jgi:hypothetical protein
MIQKILVPVIEINNETMCDRRQEAVSGTV